MADTLTLVTYNIHFGVGVDGRYDLERVADAVAGADIICLQEVTRFWAPCGHDDQPARLAAYLNRHASYAPAVEVGRDETGADGQVRNRPWAFGNMVLSRWPIVYARMHSLPRPPATDVPPNVLPKVDLPRCALEAVIETPGGPLRVLCTHLSQLSAQQRQAQLATLKGLVRELPREAPLWEAMPGLEAFTEGRSVPPVPAETVLMGDFNFSPMDPEYAQMLAADEEGDKTTPMVLQDGWTVAGKSRREGITFQDESEPPQILDYAFLTPGLARCVTSAHVDATVRGSDHFPVFFTLKTPLP